ncbi:hypothetical protein TNCV_4141611 [Trichonephila clavipes]|nr:hypothetical protein TNCV_4141611 [Trichonephila clavipes]
MQQLFISNVTRDCGRATAPPIALPGYVAWREHNSRKMCWCSIVHKPHVLCAVAGTFNLPQTSGNFGYVQASSILPWCSKSLPSPGPSPRLLISQFSQTKRGDMFHGNPNTSCGRLFSSSFQLKEKKRSAKPQQVPDPFVVETRMFAAMEQECLRNASLYAK